METVSSQFPLCLWVIYPVNNISVTGLTDLTVTVYDENGNLILDQKELVESAAVPGYYSYELDLSCTIQLSILEAFFKKGNDLIKVERYFVGCPHDNFGHAF